MFLAFNVFFRVFAVVGVVVDAPQLILVVSAACRGTCSRAFATLHLAEWSRPCNPRVVSESWMSLFPKLLCQPFQQSDSTQHCGEQHCEHFLHISAISEKAYLQRTRGILTLTLTPLRRNLSWKKRSSVTAPSSRRLDSPIVAFVVQPDLY